MEYQGSPHNENSKIDDILATLNFILIVVIVLCTDYMFIKFLF